MNFAQNISKMLTHLQFFCFIYAVHLFYLILKEWTELEIEGKRERKEREAFADDSSRFICVIWRLGV